MSETEHPHTRSEPLVSAPRIVALGHPSLDRMVDTFCDALAFEPGNHSDIVARLRDSECLRLGLVIGQRLASVVTVGPDSGATLTTLRRWRGTGVDRQLLEAGIGWFRARTNGQPRFRDEQLDRHLAAFARTVGAQVAAEGDVDALVPV